MIEKWIEVLCMISEDMKNDAKKIDGQPLNGKTVATYFGYQGAAISAIANILKAHLEASRQSDTANGD